VASLSKRYAVSPSVLAGWNKVSASASFHSGQVVILYLPTTASTGNQHKGVGKARVQRKAASKPLHSTKK
jgi:membrane-bound lytic murein transglycosylase D